MKRLQDDVIACLAKVDQCLDAQADSRMQQSLNEKVRDGEHPAVWCESVNICRQEL